MQEVMTYHTSAVQAERIHERLESLSRIGGLENGGMNRVSYGPDDPVARDLVATWMEELGLTVRIDAAGNVCGVWEGADPTLPVVMVGSHLDTQPGGGRFDGMAGVVAALEAVDVLKGAGSHFTRGVEVVAWAGEEGSGRFDVGLVGSRAMVGQLTEEHLRERCRLTGKTLGDLMRQTGSDLTDLASVERPEGSIAVVLELHIEQGPYLEESGTPLGVVRDIAGNQRLVFEIQGVQAHSGAQPMSYRRDALCAEAEIILAAERIAAGRTAPAVVATSGYSSHFPQMIAAVPGRAEIVVDVRSVSPEALVETTRKIAHEAEEICRRRGVELTTPGAWGVEPTQLDPRVGASLTDACRTLDIPHTVMSSGAGHDAMMLGKRFPAGMIFVPSRAGISHAPAEFTEVGAIALGTQVLTEGIVTHARPVAR